MFAGRITPTGRRVIAGFGTWKGKPRVRCVAIVLACTVVLACGGPDRKKFEGTRRAGVAISTAVGKGVSAPRYRELVLQLEAQLAILKGRAVGPQETEIVEKYDDATRAYRAALAVWTLKVEGQSDRVFAGGTLDRLLAPYDIPFAEGASGIRQTSADVAMRHIWAIAGAKLETANNALNSK